MKIIIKNYSFFKRNRSIIYDNYEVGYFYLNEIALIVKVFKILKLKNWNNIGCICEQCENGYSKSDNRICKLCNYDKIIKND